MKRFVLICLTIFFGLSVPALSPAQADLDPQFGENGQLTTDFSIYDDKAYAITVQTDGKIIIAGQSENGADTDIAVARYNSDGTIDTGFNYSGQVTIAVGSGNDTGLAIAVQKDGKILVAGTTENNGSTDVAIIRLHSDGILDMDFDDDGQLTLPIANSDDSAHSILIQEDGKIILAGSRILNTEKDLFLARLHSDGSPDTSFADHGMLTGTEGYEATARGAILQENGHILLAGSTKESTVVRAALFSFLANGRVDSAYGENGVVLSGPEDQNSLFNDLIAVDNGKVVATGAVEGVSYRSILLAGFTETGALDPTFNNGSFVLTDLGNDTIANSLTMAEDSTIYLAGSGSKGSDTDFILLHYSANGHEISNSLPAATAGEEEKSQSITVKALVIEKSYSDEITTTAPLKNYTLTDFNQYNDVANSLIALKNGKILVAGTAENGKDSDFALLSFTSDQLSFLRASNGVDTWGYYIATTLPTHVTRNSAASGGYIRNNNIPETTVTQRGVCYAITPGATWKDSFDSAPETPTTTTTTDTDDDGKDISDLFKTDTVKEWCTKDGDGLGEFRTDLIQMIAGTTYYARAYGKLSDDSVIYGNEFQFTTNDACFIATAAFTSQDKTQVKILRQFRDAYLKPSVLGRKFIDTYYQFSPPLAQIIAERPLLQAATRCLLAPLTTLSYLSLNPYLALQLAGLTLFILLLFLINSSKKKIKAHSSPPVHGMSGFTLIELLVVLVIIGILAGYVGPRIMGRPDEAKRTMAESQMSALGTALEMYRLDNGSYPTTDQGLQALVTAPASGRLAKKWRKGGYMKKVPTDPWDNDYVYLSPGSHSDFDITSYGLDGESGGEDADADINNWETE